MFGLWLQAPGFVGLAGDPSSLTVGPYPYLSLTREGKELRLLAQGPSGKKWAWEQKSGVTSGSRVCTACVVSSLGEPGKGREGLTPGARRTGLAAGESQAGLDLAALWLLQASGQMTDLPILELS